MRGERVRHHIHNYLGRERVFPGYFTHDFLWDNVKRDSYKRDINEGYREGWEGGYWVKRERRKRSSKLRINLHTCFDYHTSRERERDSLKNLRYTISSRERHAGSWWHWSTSTVKSIEKGKRIQKGERSKRKRKFETHRASIFEKNVRTRRPSTDVSLRDNNNGKRHCESRARGDEVYV